MDTTVRSELKAPDGCPVLTKLQAFVIAAGECPRLEHVLRDRQGNPLAIPAGAQVVARTKEAIAAAGYGNVVEEITGSIDDHDEGVISFPAAPNLSRPGIYNCSIGLVDADGKPLKVDTQLVWVEPSLFAAGSECGPPSLSDVRQELMDAGAAENLLLDDVEFNDSEIASAILRPIQYFNEIPPPLRHADSRNFPFRRHWMTGIVAHLLRSAAHSYRRNQLAYSAGGVQVDDKNKEGAYLQASELLFTEYKSWCAAKKMEINTQLFGGYIASEYAGVFA